MAGASRRIARAVELYTQAAAQGDDTAQNNLGEMYEHGRGVPYDAKRAVELYAQAAERGYANAQCNLGVLKNIG